MNNSVRVVHQRQPEFALPLCIPSCYGETIASEALQWHTYTSWWSYEDSLKLQLNASMGELNENVGLLANLSSGKVLEEKGWIDHIHD